MGDPLENKYKVCVSCMTYNHATYIVDAMDGFCIQETSFPFVCTIVDDASTDETTTVINRYLAEHFDLCNNEIVKNVETDDYFLIFSQHKLNRNCFFAVLFLKYNHHQIKKTKLQYLKEWRSNAKYIAWCEGDDYWIDSNKLKLQVECLEKHSNFSMVCNRTKLFSDRRKKYIGENYCYNKSQIVDPNDIIRRTGLFISSCSIVYRREISDNIPDYWKQCKVGDYPLQIMCSMKGQVYYFNDIMSVYRVENSNSWRGQQDINKETERRFDTIFSEVNMFKGFAKDYPIYSSVIHDKIGHFLCSNYPTRNESKEIIRRFLTLFKNDLSEMDLFWKFILFLKKLNIPGVLTMFYPITKKYTYLVKRY